MHGLNPLRRYLILPYRRYSSKPSASSSPSASLPPASPTPLQKHLHRQIRYDGPITLASYMQHCLTHPTHGYYTTRNPIGPRGDFTTSPQISPIFSELLAVWIAHTLSKTAKAPYHLIELGPGTGAFLSTALPALSRLGHAPASVTLVDTSDSLRKTQRAALSAPHLPPLSWAPSLEHVLSTDGDTPPRRVFVLHEFLDALPVHVFQRASDGEPSADEWHQRLVDVDPDVDDEQAQLRLVLTASKTPAHKLLQLHPPPRDARIAEVGAERIATVQAVARAVRDGGGAALLVDYGKDRHTGDTLRAFSRHEQVDVLHRPGECDLTADVDFAAVRSAVEMVSREGAQGVSMAGTVSQREFLLSLGISERFRRVAKVVIERGEKNGESGEVIDKKLEQLQTDYEKLVGKAEMGELFQVAAIIPEKIGDLAGGLEVKT